MQTIQQKHSSCVAGFE